jgi:hypothetical protein
MPDISGLVRMLIIAPNVVVTGTRLNPLAVCAARLSLLRPAAYGRAPQTSAHST